MAELLSVVAFRSELAARLEARADEMVDAISSALFAELGSLHELARASDNERLRARLRATVDAFARFVAEHRRVPDADRESLHRMGAEWARQGVSVDVVRDCVDITVSVLWRFVREVVQQPPVPPMAAAVVADLGLEAPTFVEALREPLVAGFTLERRHGDIGRVYAVADVVDVLIEGRWVTRRDLIRAADALGLDISEPLAVFLVAPSRPGHFTRLDEAAREIATVVPGAAAGRLRGGDGRYIPMVAPHADPATVREALHEAATRLGVLVVLDQATYQHRELVAAVTRLEHELAPALALGRGAGVVSTTDTELFRLLRLLPLEERIAYTRRVLGPVLALPGGKSGDAIATMQAYFRGRAAGRLDERAADLQLHRNSFRYRLDRTQVLLGVSFRDAADRLRVEVALALHELARQELALADAQDDEESEAGNG